MRIDLTLKRQNNKWMRTLSEKLFHFHKTDTFAVIQIVMSKLCGKNAITFVNFVFFVFPFVRLKPNEGNICFAVALHWICIQCATRCTNHGADSNFKSRVKRWTGWSIPIQVNVMHAVATTTTAATKSYLSKFGRRHTKLIESIRYSPLSRQPNNFWISNFSNKLLYRRRWMVLFSFRNQLRLVIVSVGKRNLAVPFGMAFVIVSLVVVFIPLCFDYR